MTRFLVGLFLAALTLGWDDLAAQRPAQRPPAPPTERAGPEGPPAGAAQLTRADVQAWLDGFLPYALQVGDIPGAVVVVVKDGEVLFKKGYGYADLKTKEAGRSRPHAVPARLGLQALHLDCGDAAGRTGQARPG